MTISTPDTRNEYTATAAQTVFNYTFKIFSSTDLNVYVTAAGATCDDTTDLTTAYTVSGVGLAAGGAITLTTPSTVGDLVTIVGNIPASRTTDYQSNGDFIPATVNADFDRVVSLVKQAEELNNRTLVSPECLQGPKPLSLPAPVALNFMRWKSDLSGTENVDLTLTGAPANASVITYNQGGTGALDRTAEERMRETVSVDDFGADPTGVTDSITAFNSAITHLKGIGGGTLRIPGKIYKLDSVWNIATPKGITIQGTGAFISAAGDKGVNTSVLDFDGAASGVSGVVVSDFVGFEMKDLFISVNRGAAGGGIGLEMHTGHNFRLEGLAVDNNTGSAGIGIALGRGAPATSAFVGAIENCKVICDGKTYQSNKANTSLTFQSCYGIGGPYEILGTVYSSFVSCACDSSTDHGYIIDGDASFNSTNLTFVSCGAEAAFKSAFYLARFSQNITFIGPYSSGGNTEASAANPDLMLIDSSAGFVEQITIIGPTALLGNAATTSNIFANASTRQVNVIGLDTTVLALGINGDATWKDTKLNIQGDTHTLSGLITTNAGQIKFPGTQKPSADVNTLDDYEEGTFTPTLVSWTNVGAPTVEGFYTKIGDMVYANIKITPDTSVSATLVTSTITGMPFTPGEVAVGAMVNHGTAASLGSVSLTAAASGTIFPQTTGVVITPNTLGITVAYKL